MKRRPGERDAGAGADTRVKAHAGVDADADADADVRHFAREMADVARLPSDPRGRVRAAPRLGPPRAAAPRGASPGRDADDDAEAGFVAPGVDRRELRKLKRGDYIPGRRLDLHGQTAADAVTAVTRFVEAARPSHRCICIVHGRGLHSAGNVAVLKARVRECLRRHPAVLACADAPRDAGGAGAVYVLLRK